MEKLPFKLDSGVNPIFIEVDHTIDGYVVVKKHDWNLILEVLSHSNEIKEFDEEEK